MNSKQRVQATIPTWNGRLFCHIVGYNGDGHVHRGIPSIVNMNKPSVISKEMNLLHDDGFDGIFITWQGIFAKECHFYTLVAAAVCAQLGMQFGLLLDPWCAKLGPAGQDTNFTQNVITSISDNSTQALLNFPNYIPEKFVLDFTTGANLIQLASKFPNLKFLAQGSGFSWINFPPKPPYPTQEALNAWAVSNLASQHANPAMEVASYFDSFNDSGMPLPANVGTQAAFNAAGGNRDLTRGVWGDNPARILDSFSGEFGVQQLATINPKVPIIVKGTGNDYDEQSSGPWLKVLGERAGVDWLAL